MCLINFAFVLDSVALRSKANRILELITFHVLSRWLTLTALDEQTSWGSKTNTFVQPAVKAHPFAQEVSVDLWLSWKTVNMFKLASLHSTPATVVEMIRQVSRESPTNRSSTGSSKIWIEILQLITTFIVKNSKTKTIFCYQKCCNV